MLGEWNSIEADFQQTYGIDLTEVRHERTWRWFKVRLAGLLQVESRIQAQFNPPKKNKE